MFNFVELYLTNNFIFIFRLINKCCFMIIQYVGSMKNKNKYFTVWTIRIIASVSYFQKNV